PLAVGAHRANDGRPHGDGPAAQIIDREEAAWHHHEVGARRQRGVGMPDHGRLAAADKLERARHVALAIDAGKDDDGGFHQSPSSFSAHRSTKSPLRKPKAARSAVGTSSATTVATTTSHLSLKAMASAMRGEP